ncbi:hypothetical protein LguiA_016887 [Lonicera macranthoides]
MSSKLSARGHGQRTWLPQSTHLAARQGTCLGGNALGCYITVMLLSCVNAVGTQTAKLQCFYAQGSQFL